MYWQVRFEKDTVPTAMNRNMVCFKYIPHCQMSDGSPCVDANGVPKDPSSPLGIDPWDAQAASAYQRVRLTARWRDHILGRPEQNVVGQMYQDWVRSGATFSWVVFDESHWAFTGTGLSNGGHISGIIGGEFDRVFRDGESYSPSPDPIFFLTPSSLQILALSEFANEDAGIQYSNSTIYQAPSGAFVFSAGTITWSWGLADEEELGPAGFSNPVTHAFADERIQLFTANILNTFITRTLPSEFGGPRIGVLQGDGTLFVKEGALDAAWWLQGSNILRFALSGNRIGVLTKDGNLFLRERLFGTVFKWESSDVQSFALSGDRIGVLHTDGNLYVKEGPWDAAWTPAIPNVQSFALDGNRVGFLDTSGNMNLIEGALNPLPAPMWESSDVQSLALSGDRIGVVHNDGNLYVKEGPWDAAWTPAIPNVQSFILAGDRVGFLDNAGNVNAIEGALNPLPAPMWESSDVQNFELTS